MRRLILLIAALALAVSAGAGTVVLRGGKHLEVASFTQQGTFLIVHYANGRVESYPLAMVDLEATQSASGAPPPAATPVPTPVGPHSPFLGAQAPVGKASFVLTDEDVKHVIPPEEEEGEGEETEAGSSASGGQVVVANYQKAQQPDGSWQVTVTVANRGDTPVTNVTADIQLLDDKGNQVGSATGSLVSTLEASQQANITARIVTTGNPFQVSSTLRWQAIKTVPATPGAIPKPALPIPAKRVAPTPAPAPAPEGFTVPAGSSPNTLPSNPMAVPPLTEPPIPAQAPPPSPPPSS